MKMFKFLGYGSIIFVILVVFGTMLQSIPQKQEKVINTLLWYGMKIVSTQ